MNQPSLQHVPLFAHLPPDEIERLSQTFHQARHDANTVLFLEGDTGDRFSVILEGQLEVVKALGTSEERSLAVMGPGEFFGEMSLLYSNGLRSASVRTLTPVQLMDITQEDFIGLLSRQPELSVSILREVISRIRSAETATIFDLEAKNRELEIAYSELKAAQARLIANEKLELEIQMARRIQESILPKHLPDLPGWTVEAHWQPARWVSGDFFDFINLPDGRWGVVIADVTDKGVPAAMVMATTRSILRSTAFQRVSPSEVLYHTNNLLVPDMPQRMFVTCLYGVLDPATGEFTFANAGHCLPCQHSTGEGLFEVKARGMPLGLMPDMTYEEKQTLLRPGDRLCLYTDGLVEAHNPAREMFGCPRLLSLMAGARDKVLIHFLLQQLAEFTGPGWEQEDDVTLMTLERLSA